ncbi:hypothetical protein GCM10009850_084500 [Nonomuraea monospora]|uniref:Uncharacterized protein n=1 Tax=Nonomuraea monospora TaxID=568818 RepID=A0ABP5PQE1_9ACTN
MDTEGIVGGVAFVSVGVGHAGVRVQHKSWTPEGSRSPSKPAHATHNALPRNEAPPRTKAPTPVGAAALVRDPHRPGDHMGPRPRIPHEVTGSDSDVARPR